MTALAVALVLCCAMVCGTVLAHGHMRYTRAARFYADKADRAQARAESAMDAVKLVAERLAEMDRADAALRTELEQLRAQLALRSV